MESIVEDMSFLFSEKRHRMESALFDFSDFRICELSRSEFESSTYLFSKIKCSKEMQKFKETVSFREFIKDCVVTDMTLALTDLVAKTLEEASSTGEYSIMSHRTRADLVHKQGHGDFSKVFASNVIPLGEIVSFDREKLSVSIHNEMQVEHKSGIMPSLEFKLPVIVSLN